MQQTRVGLPLLVLLQFRKSFSFLEREGWRAAVTGSISVASASGESSLIPLLRLSPRDPLRWARAGTPKAAPRNAEKSWGRRLVQETLQLFRAAGMAQLSEGLGLDLADALPGNVEFLAHFLQGAGAAVLDAEAEL